MLEALEAVRGHATLSDGREITAGLLADRFGFRGEKARTLVRDLSGGERRRLQLMRLLMGEPNVLLLDEPTNDLDIDTLRALEDLLDGWPGTLVVVSHDRYFVERVCDDVYALTGDGGVRHLPGGIEQYLELRREARGRRGAARRAAARSSAAAGAVLRAARKEVGRLERALEKLAEREQALHDDMAASATDHARLRELQAELDAVAAEREDAEAAWLEQGELLCSDEVPAPWLPPHFISGALCSRASRSRLTGSPRQRGAYKPASETTTLTKPGTGDVRGNRRRNRRH